MRISRFPSAVLLGLTVVLLSCFGGPPNAPVAGTLGPAGEGQGTRAKGAFAVVFAGPRGTVTDLQQPAVTVLFNHAAHDPDGADSEGLPGATVATEEGRPVPGAWQWVGTHGLLFTPDQALAGSTRFVVTVAAGARALDGEALAADYRFEFATTRPSIVHTVPEEGASDVRPDAPFRIEFNQPMDPGEVGRAVHLFARGRADGEGRPIEVRATHPASGPGVDRTILLDARGPAPARQRD